MSSIFPLRARVAAVPGPGFQVTSVLLLHGGVMRKIGFAVSLFAIILAGIPSLLLLAQSPPNLENGFKPYGSYDGGRIDTVNLMNGNLILHIRAPFHYGQRGTLDPHY